MGFGLFWTKDYIEGLGGSIEVESTYKSGTAFSLMLPLGREQT
jgi:sensor histidine kinase regulating citrate/malate metabolism